MVEDRLLRAVWHRILFAWGIGYVVFASTLHPPYPYADVVNGVPWLFEVWAYACAAGCFTHAMLGPRVPMWADKMLLGVILAMGASRTIVLIASKGYPAASWAMMTTATQYGLYVLVLNYKRQYDSIGG